MKPPLTVEAKVAEELRTWLATELEQLNASNLNQFAHHVVTILLHEDLDIEDEPLTTGDDFLRDIYNIKNGKTRDKQKKAAVQFLRGAVCCEDPMEEEIQGVVDELMVKIEDMKSKMNSRKSSKRNLLAPIAINVEAPFRQACIKSDGSEEERYNEAFPSLSGEESPCKESAVPVSSNDSVWSTLSMGKENHRRKKRKSPQQRNKQANATFSSADEAEASAIARRVAALAISESSLPNPEAADVPSASKGSLSMMTNHPRCWKSAFMPRTLTRIFRPIQTPVIFMESREACQITTPKTFSAIILQRFCEPLDECLECISEPQKTAKSLDAFIPIKDVGPRSRTTEKDLQSSDKITESDLEVETIFTWAKHREEKARRHEKKQGKGKSESGAWVQAEVNLNQRSSETFSNHFGAFWQRLIHCGAIVLYPELNTTNSCGGQSCPMASNTEVAEGHQDCFTTRHTKSHESPVQRSFSDCLNLSHDDSKGHFDGSTFGDCGFADYRKESYSTESFLIRPQSEDIQEVAKFVDVLLADDTDEPGDQNVSRCSYKTLTPNVEDFFPSESLQFGYGQNSRVQQPLQPWESLWSKTAWDNIQEDLLSDLKLQRRSFKDNSGVNVFMPSMLSSCLTSRGDQLLQSAYVNSFFANSFLSLGPGSESKKGLQCSEVEKYLFSNVRDLSNNSPGFPAPMIRGQTCSGWLENNCTLGLLCPFSHPSIAAYYKPRQNISFDEAMIAYHGRLAFKQYIKGKPNPWGIKVWCAAEAETGYLLKFSIYTGKVNDPMPHGMGYHVIQKLGEPFLHKHHHFFYDNYFSSIPLAEDLLQYETYCCSTVRANRKGWPKECSVLAGRKMKKGDIHFLQRGSLVALGWKDKRFVTLLGTNTTPGMTTVKRRSAAGPVDVEVPSLVDTYNRSMGGVDRFDQISSYYPVGRKSRKWWRYVFRFLLQTAIINSWIICSTSHRPKLRSQQFNQLEFRLSLSSSLIQGNITRRRKAPTLTPTTAGAGTANLQEHRLIRMTGNKRACFWCSKNHIFVTRGRAHETVFGCSLCQIHLGKGNCFTSYHDSIKQ